MIQFALVNGFGNIQLCAVLISHYLALRNWIFILLLIRSYPKTKQNFNNILMSAIILNSQFHWKTWLHIIVTLTLNFNSYECSLFSTDKENYQLLLLRRSLKSQFPYKGWYIVEIWTLDSPWPQKRIDEPQKSNRQHRHLSLTCP